jgi:hypothetical protein
MLTPLPSAAPSKPNLTLFLNLAAAKSLPSNPSSLSFSTNKSLSPGFPTIKSATPNTPAPYPTLDVNFAVLLKL